MKPTPIQHTSALASHYDQEAKHYDAFNEANSAPVNQLIESILQQHQVHNVLDLTCGTGSQVFYLADKGYNVVGIDINAQMLAIAQQKNQQCGLALRFELGDIRTSNVGQFDAVVSMFNAIGHLTKIDFATALANINANLKPGGLYLFDIFNLDYLLHENNITKLTIDWQTKSGATTAREIQYSTISSDGILASYDIYHEQIDDNAPQISTALQTLQVYNAEQLQILLAQHDFEVLQLTDLDGSPFQTTVSERILCVARKVSH